MPPLTEPLSLDPELRTALIRPEASPGFEWLVRHILTQRVLKHREISFSHNHQNFTVRMGGRGGQRRLRMVRHFWLSGTYERFRADRQIHINQDAVRPSPTEAALYNRILTWATRYQYHGQTNGVLVYSHHFDREWAYIALSVVDEAPTVPGITMALTPQASFDPIDPPDALVPLFADSPWWAPREMLADLLTIAPQWGLNRVRWVTADQHTPKQPGRDKTVLYLSGPSMPTLVAQLYWEPQLPFPPYGVSPTPKSHPEPVIPRKTPKPPASAEQLALFAPDETPVAPIQTRDIRALADAAMDRLETAYQTYDFLVLTLSGKDSLATVELTGAMLDRLPPDQRTKPVYLISANTKVENPVLIDVIQRLHQAIQTTADARDWPLTCRLLAPDAENTFWTQVIGKGYPPPNRLSRWCTARLKQAPNDQFIAELSASRAGQKGVLVLGVRDTESVLRSQSNARHALDGDDFYATNPLAWMTSATPVRSWTTDEIWGYLSEDAPFWEAEVAGLIGLYRYATGTCELAIAHPATDKESQTQSLFQQCGSNPGRMGCVTCTVVSRDASLEALNTAHHGLYDPYLRIQTALRQTADPRLGLRTGIQRTRASGVWTQGYGELTPSAVCWLLTLLLDANLPLADDEIAAIGQLWHDRAWRGECRMPDKAWVLLDRHARAHQPIRMLSA